MQLSLGQALPVVRQGNHSLDFGRAHGLNLGFNFPATVAHRLQQIAGLFQDSLRLGGEKLVIFTEVLLLEHDHVPDVLAFISDSNDRELLIAE